MVANIGLLLAGAALAAAAGVNRSLPLPPGTRTLKVLASLATDTAVTGTAAVYGINDNENANGGLGCRAYYGDGSTNDGWPSISQWVSFNYIWQVNYNSIQNSCSQYGVPNLSNDEMNDLENAINDIANQFNIDHRFILAEILTESSGCVRVPTTGGPATGIWNPGLLQDFDGYYTCNCNTYNGVYNEYGETCGVVDPCPADTITNMIREGAVGTDNGVGLSFLINAAEAQGAHDAQVFYVASEWYNQGEYSPNVGGSLNANCYAQKVAQWLTGCTNPVSC
ncbi:hypothetical protein THARTR1_03969 [Trichoderma harzianum]|uniref:Uncharacterized protein n=1 Tax=Trichoderma harzianum TaxID=5544 RepID=A0A2K0UD89_TRIHA|nr:hypothetical protein THARTR1_03969 [Trichoderma harzianum]